MHPGIMAQRNAQAEITLGSQSQKIAEATNSEDALKAYNEEVVATGMYAPEVQSLLEKEARIKLNDAILEYFGRADEPEGGEPGSIASIDGVGEETAKNLAEAGYESEEDIRNASDSDLKKVQGVGPAVVKRLRDATE